MSIQNDQITFVIQGPVIKELTFLSIQQIKKLFPGSPIILSTWEYSILPDVEIDLFIFNQDPGTTIRGYSKANTPFYKNANRQIHSTLQGLKSVKTKYAVKIRTDNYLVKNEFINIFSMFNKRDDRFSIFNKRIITSNYYSKEFDKGARIPFFNSDFFQFGETVDLLTLWDIDYDEAYVFNCALQNQKQHSHSPHRTLHVEQELWLKCLNKFDNIQLHDGYGSKSDIDKSYKYMINNIMIVDGDILGLVVPERLIQNNSFPYPFYTFERWKWLYSKEYKVEAKVNRFFKVKWLLGCAYMFLSKGYRVKMKSYFLHRKDKRRKYL